MTAALFTADIKKKKKMKTRSRYGIGTFRWWLKGPVVNTCRVPRKDLGCVWAGMGSGGLQPGLSLLCQRLVLAIILLPRCCLQTAGYSSREDSYLS